MASRRPNSNLQEFFMFAFDHVQVTGDTLIQLMTCQRAMRVDYAEYINVTGLAAHNDNFFNIKLQKGSTVMAGWNTDGDGTTTGINGGATEGTIAADTFVPLTKSSTDANLVAAVGDVLKLNLDETGAATLPAGRLVVHGRYV